MFMKNKILMTYLLIKLKIDKYGFFNNHEFLIRNSNTDNKNLLLRTKVICSFLEYINLIQLAH